MKKYPKYKNSNIAWLGEIPKHWVEVDTKRYFHFPKEIIGEDYINQKVLSLSVNGVIFRDMESRTGKHHSNMGTYQVIRPNSIILCLFDMDVTPRIVGHSSKTGIITSAYTNIIPKENVNSKYYYYYYLLQDYNNYLFSQGTGIRTTLTRSQFGALKISLPPIEEQIAIANFIDYKLEKINRFISKKKQLITLLNEQKKAIINQAVTKGLNPNAKLKASGIEWLGDIPVSWEVRRMKFLAKIKNGKDCDKKEIGKYPVYGSGGIFGWYDDFLYNKPSVLLGRKGTIDKPQFVKKPFWSVDTAFYTEINENVVIPLFFYYLCSSIIPFDFYSSKTALPSMTQTDLYEVKFGIPTLKKQTQIVNHIETETKKTEKTITTIEKEIDLVEEYKTALIAEAVTGKIDVRGFEIENEEVKNG